MKTRYFRDFELSVMCFVWIWAVVVRLLLFPDMFAFLFILGIGILDGVLAMWVQFDMNKEMQK